MNAEIIAVGSELLLGQIANTNAQFLSAELAALGVNVFYHTAVGDNPQRLQSVLEAAEQRSDLIILTGGLGPTKDDLTKETVAAHLGVELVTDEHAMRSIEDFFRKYSKGMTDNNRKQALVLKGSVVLPNDNGMAPGMFLVRENHAYMLLPGPPFEMKPMFLAYGAPAIAGSMEKEARIVSRVLRFFGIGEAALESKLADLIESQGNPTIAPLAGNSEVTIRLTSRHEKEEEAMKLILETEEKILERVGQYLYGYDDSTIMGELAKLLKSTGSTIAAAESLTGGMFQAGMASVPGASAFFKGGLVCYSNEAKMKLAGVRIETLEKYGAVSSQCAEELAENAAMLLGAEFGISFTGVAGPDPLEGHPPGTVFIGMYRKGKGSSFRQLTLGGTREIIRERVVKHGCRMLIEELKS